MQNNKKNEVSTSQKMPVNSFVKPSFNNTNNNFKNKQFNAPQKGVRSGFMPGTFKTQHKG